MMNEDRDHEALNEGWARFLPERFRGPVVPVVHLSGTIGAVTPLRPGLSLSGVARLLERAFATKGAKAPLTSLVKPRRKTPPALPVLPTAVVQGLRPGNWHSAGPSTSQASSP